MRTLIIDDDELNINLLKNFCKKYAPAISIVGWADNVDDGIAEIINKKPDLLFLDIELHDRTGFDILDAVNEPDLMVIMITAHEKYAVKAFRARVMDYLLKPLSIRDFVGAVDLCKKEFEKKQLELAPDNKPLDYLFINIPFKDHIEVMPVENILHLESHGKHTIITTINNMQRKSSKMLKDYEDKLPTYLFLRVHHSHIVNITGISKVLRSKNGSLVLTNGIEIPISSQRKKEVLDRLLS